MPGGFDGDDPLGHTRTARATISGAVASRSGAFPGWATTLYVRSESRSSQNSEVQADSAAEILMFRAWLWSLIPTFLLAVPVTTVYLHRTVTHRALRLHP